MCVVLLAAVAAAQQSSQETQQTAPQPNQSPAAVAPVASTPAPANSGLTDNAPPATDANGSQDALRLGPGDLVDVAVFGAPDLAQEFRISSTGDASLALIGRVKLAGLTIEDAQSAVEKALADGGFVNDPHVTISVKEFATQGISVMGEVNKPGIYPLIGPRRLFDVISAAGGLTQTAGQTVTITRRDRPFAPITVSFAQDPAKSFESNIDIYPGDTVAVSRAGVVYVVGDVGQPGGFVINTGQTITVLQAVALAKGANRTAASGKAKIIRRTESGPVELPIPLDKILSSQSKDIALQADDIVFVPNSAARSAARKGLEAIVQTAVGVAIYRP